jgi:hypothetical protein
MRVVDTVTGTVVEQGAPYQMKGKSKVLVVEEAKMDASGRAKIRVRIGKCTCPSNPRVTVVGKYNPQSGDVEFVMPWDK